MNVNCPYCGKKINIDDILADDDMRAIMRLATAFGPHGPQVWAYIELFGVVPFSTHRKKLLHLLHDIKRLLEAEQFHYQKVEYQITRAGIAEALATVARRHFADRLENHNYLKKIMIGIAEREEQARGKQAEADLRDREERARRRGAGTEITEEQRQENLQRVNDIIRGI